MSNQKKDGEQQKGAVSRYEQKLEKRRLKAKKEAQSQKIYSLAFGAVVLVVAAVMAAAIVIPVLNKNKALKNTYVAIGEHQLNKLEYDYYNKMTINNFLNAYGSAISYIGLDIYSDYAKQQYTENMTWKDNFDQMTVAQIINTKALADEAAANGFTTDLTESYNAFITNMQTNAANAGVTEAQYYKESFGSYATKTNIEPFVKENLLAEAYYDELLIQKAPAAEEITAYYEANKNEYDKVNYRSFTFQAELAEEPTEAEIAAAMEDLSARAEAMVAARKTGQDFNALCREYAPEADKAAYEDEAADGSLTENGAYLSLPSSYRDWLFDETRIAGDIIFTADETSHSVYVVEFEARNYDETTDAAISEILAGQAVTGYIAELAAKYEVIDVAGDLDYLRIEETAAATEAETAEAAAGEAGAAAATEAGTAASETGESETAETKAAERETGEAVTTETETTVNETRSAGTAKTEAAASEAVNAVAAEAGTAASEAVDTAAAQTPETEVMDTAAAEAHTSETEAVDTGAAETEAAGRETADAGAAETGEAETTA